MESSLGWRCAVRRHFDPESCSCGGAVVESAVVVEAESVAVAESAVVDSVAVAVFPVHAPGFDSGHFSHRHHLLLTPHFVAAAVVVVAVDGAGGGRAGPQDWPSGVDCRGRSQS